MRSPWSPWWDGEKSASLFFRYTQIHREGIRFFAMYKLFITWSQKARETPTKTSGQIARQALAEIGKYAMQTTSELRQKWSNGVQARNSFFTLRGYASVRPDTTRDSPFSVPLIWLRCSRSVVLDLASKGGPLHYSLSTLPPDLLT